MDCIVFSSPLTLEYHRIILLGYFLYAKDEVHKLDKFKQRVIFLTLQIFYVVVKVTWLIDNTGL